jgi:integrase
MATGQITKRAIDALKPTKAIGFLWDAGDGALKGFGVRITPAGVKSYVYQYRLGGRAGKARRYTIGRHGEFAPDQARERARQLAELVRRGIDPIEAEEGEAKSKAQAKQIEARREMEARELAFNAYALRFLDSHVKPKTPDSYAFSEAILRLHATPVLTDKILPSITRRDILKVIDQIPAGRPSVRRNTFAVLRKLFNWARARDDLDRSPMEGMDSPPLVASRDRVLNDNELALAYKASLATPYPFGPMFELLFATGQRRDEVAGLDWSELDRESAMWTLPRERAKNNEANIIPLNRLAIAALDRAARKGMDGATDWPSKGLVYTTTGKTSVSGYSKAKAKLDSKMLGIARQAALDASQEPLEAIATWRVHDARRTLATGLQRLGVRFEVTEAVLNHVSGSRSGVAGVYQRHGWGPEKRAALEAWGAHIEKLLNPADESNNVVRLRAKRPRAARGK